MKKPSQRFISETASNSGETCILRLGMYQFYQSIYIRRSLELEAVSKVNSSNYNSRKTLIILIKML